MKPEVLAFCSVLALSGLPLACGSDDDGGSSNAGGSAGTGGSGGSDAAVGGSSGSGGDAGDAASDVTTDVPVTAPTPGDIQFSAVSALPQGEQILFNDWSPQPNALYSMKPDGSGETKVFEAYRIWSLGVSHDTQKIAFACGDPAQSAHYGVDIGDAIQHTWLYDVATQAASVLAYGNLNDECHSFTPKDDGILVCRRRDFNQSGGNKTYRVGRLSLTGSLGWLGIGEDSTPTTMELHPQLTDDEQTLFYTLIQISGGSQNRSIVKRALPGGAPEIVKAAASSGVLSPDGTRILYADTSQKSALFSMKLDGSDPIKVASRNGTNAAWSPDGSHVAYLWGETMGCNHIEVVAANGSEADAPKRIRDCGTSFVTELAWIVRP
ncbi:MAG: hypothetical protein U0263_24870 [Polyangiaceae bacterium]